MKSVSVNKTVVLLLGSLYYDCDYNLSVCKASTKKKMIIKLQPHVQFSKPKVRHRDNNFYTHSTSSVMLLFLCSLDVDVNFPVNICYL